MVFEGELDAAIAPPEDLVFALLREFFVEVFVPILDMPAIAVFPRYVIQRQEKRWCYRNNGHGLSFLDSSR